MTVNRWVQWTLAASLLCTTGLAMAVAPVEDAMPEGSQASVSDADYTTTSGHVSGEAHHNVAPTPASGDDSDHRTRWEDTSDDADFHPPAPANTNTQSDNNASSLAQLTQQVNNMAAMNLPERLDELQHSIAQLRGQLQVQQHALQQLQAKVAHASKGGASHSPKLRAVRTTKPVAKHPSLAEQPQQDNAEASQKAYTTAFDALMNKQYSTAKTGFEAYLQHFPQGAYVSNANYWLAEIALVKRQYKEAEKRLGIVISKFPNSSKYPDARYKLAMTHLRMHQTQLAKEELRALSHDFAGKTVGRLANIALEQMDLD